MLSFLGLSSEMKPSFHRLLFICFLLCNHASAQTVTYTVKPGDSLSKIARSHGCSVEALAKTNGIKLGAVIQAGQKLKVPVPSKPAQSATTGSHVIQPGDTFSSISRQYNIPVESLLVANVGLDPKSLKPGQKITLSTTDKPAAVSSASSELSRAPRGAEPPQAGHPSDTANPESEKQEAVNSPVPPGSQPAGEKIQTVVVEVEITFGEFANKHGSDIQRLNELNGLDLIGSTVLAKGSELYVPVQAKAQP